MGDEFQRCLHIVDKDRSGEIEYKELARAIKYGDPRRIESMQAHQRELERLADSRSKPTRSPKSASAKIVDPQVSSSPEAAGKDGVSSDGKHVAEQPADDALGLLGSDGAGAP